MSFNNIFVGLQKHEQIEAIEFAASAVLKSLLFQRIREVEKEINELKPENADPVTYIRHAHDLHARKEELQDLFQLIQEILSKSTPQQEG